MRFPHSLRAGTFVTFGSPFHWPDRSLATWLVANPPGRKCVPCNPTNSQLHPNSPTQLPNFTPSSHSTPNGLHPNSLTQLPTFSHHPRLAKLSEMPSWKAAVEASEAWLNFQLGERKVAGSISFPQICGFRMVFGIGRPGPSLKLVGFGIGRPGSCRGYVGNHPLLHNPQLPKANRLHLLVLLWYLV